MNSKGEISHSEVSFELVVGFTGEVYVSWSSKYFLRAIITVLVALFYNFLPPPI